MLLEYFDQILIAVHFPYSRTFFLTVEKDHAVKGEYDYQIHFIEIEIPGRIRIIRSHYYITKQQRKTKGCCFTDNA